jgi:UDP-N-acetylmuramoyl-tripeptide--D-alanyl-D-alanine ligase
VILSVGAALAAIVAGLRWLRVAQREHYLPPAATLFALRWWWSSWINRALALVMVVGGLGEWWKTGFGWLAVAAQVGPIGLALRGRTSRLAWTTRLRRLAVTAGLLYLAFLILALVGERPAVAVAGVVAVPLIVDLAMAILRPVEHRMGGRFIEQADAILRATGARVVAVTGSYGKTTTKVYITHLVSGRYVTVASPASFNNRMGLARAVNEQLGPGTEVFVAEMGAYGPGEIAELCAWIPPEVAVISAIGPVHLERFGSEERIVEAKREILKEATVGVINIDHPGLARVADEERPARRIVTCSALDRRADVSVVGGEVTMDGRLIGQVDPDRIFPANLACALGAALALGVAADDLGQRLATLPQPAHRRQLAVGAGGFTIIDDTFNANPEGAKSALSLLASLGEGGRRVVVTPGMIELGSLQSEANRAFAAEAAATADELVIVGSTNRRSLLDGADGGRASVIVLPSRQAAVARVGERLGKGDVVLFENDLPDHYP